MPVNKYEWSAIDHAATLVISELTSEKHYSIRDIVRLSHGQLKYNRTRDIMMGKSSPVRISEFTLFCKICNHNPIIKFMEVCEKANWMQQRSLHYSQQFDDGTIMKPTDEELDREPIINSDIYEPFLGKYIE